MRAACACARRGVRRGPGTRRRARGAHALTKPIRAERIAPARSHRSHAKGRESRRRAIGFAPSAVESRKFRDTFNHCVSSHEVMVHIMLLWNVLDVLECVRGRSVANSEVIFDPRL